ncbi:hypothetical protein RF11_11742 [Thelohanellus kitauei]|uniref:Uncharacterized protein n=1 Tax=Thelohanellus kitauei TaxID=669202 RepID=A0A0C2N4F8_THEKT|nr:hypothetical protein RF11_11742 [Thelohanellus kitauei]
MKITDKRFLSIKTFLFFEISLNLVAVALILLWASNLSKFVIISNDHDEVRHILKQESQAVTFSVKLAYIDVERIIDKRFEAILIRMYRKFLRRLRNAHFANPDAFTVGLQKLWNLYEAGFRLYNGRVGGG